MADRNFQFFRCPNGTVAFDTVFSGGSLYQLDRNGVCPLCGTPVAEHDTFVLRASPADPAGKDVA